MADLLEITGANFENEVAKADVPVLMDFWAPWCGPCKRLSPVVEAIARQYDGKLKVVKCNTDEAQDVASKYGIMSIPTLLLFKEGQVREQIVGAVSQKAIEDKLATHLS